MVEPAPEYVDPAAHVRSAVDEALDDTPIVVVQRARQVGKSTLTGRCSRPAAGGGSALTPPPSTPPPWLILMASSVSAGAELFITHSWDNERNGKHFELVMEMTDDLPQRARRVDLPVAQAGHSSVTSNVILRRPPRRCSATWIAELLGPGDVRLDIARESAGRHRQARRVEKQR